MSHDSEIEESSLIECLSNIDQYLARLRNLPTKTEFAEAVERDLWEAVSQEPSPPSKMRYAKLPDEAHTLIGTTDEGEGPPEPWWLREFDWKASFGGEELVLRGDDLEIFANKFDRGQVSLHQPVLSSSGNRTAVVDMIDALKNIQSILEDRIEPASDAPRNELPDSLFNVEEKLVEPTNEFGDWLDALLALAPGIGPEATALYLAHTGTSREAAESALDEELFEKVDQVVSFNYSSYQPKIVKEFDTVLGISRIFTHIVPKDSSYDNLSGLQYQLYRGFLTTFEPRDEFTKKQFNSATRQKPARFEKGDHGRFTRIACGTPLIRYADNRPKLMSVGMYSPKSNDSGYLDNGYRDVRNMFENKGWFNDA